MDEFKFVLRSLVLATIIMFVSQYKVDDQTLETKAEYLFVESSTASQLRETAAGAAKFIRKSLNEGSYYLEKKFFKNKEETHQPDDKN